MQTIVERNLRLLLAYDGTAYAGWQRQRDLPTIQGTVEAALQRLLSAKVDLHGAGRTDAGVHAEGMVANFRTTSGIPPAGIRKGLNSLLPPDIRVLTVATVAADFHARYSARGKVYGYRFSTAEILQPCDRLYWAHFPGRFRAGPVRAVLGQLVGEHDFSSFEASGSRDPARPGRRGAVRRIERLELHRQRGKKDSYHFVIAGDGFLRHMVRNMVGTLIQVGQGRREGAGIGPLLAARDRRLAGPTAPARGLSLLEVLY